MQILPRQPQRQSLETAVVPAPVGGGNTVDPGNMLPPLQCVYGYNVIPGEQGLRTRLGYQEWCADANSGPAITGASNNEVRTSMPFHGSASSGSQDQLFGVTSSGIWDVTVSGAVGTQLITFGTQTGKAGYGVYTVVTNSAGAKFLLYTDEVNGLYVYTESTDTWAKVAMGGGASQISGVDPANFVFVMQWKSRVFYVEKDTGNAWYTDIGSIYGTVTKFVFGGGKMSRGGSLRGLWSWTYDGGSGIDDALVGVSDGADIAIYRGTDPSSVDTFGLVGAWNVGSVPAGRRICTDNGGELLVLTGSGVLPLSRLVAGVSVEDRQLYSTRDISNEFSLLVSQYGTLDGWAFQHHPTDNALLLLVPTESGSATNQLAMSLSTKGWYHYRDLPILSACIFEGEMFFGTADGRMCRSAGYVDNVLVADTDTYTPVDYSLLTAFRDLGNANKKQVKWVRPVILSEALNPLYSVKAKYDYDLEEIDAPSGNPAASSSGWGSGVWDTAVWGGSYTANQKSNGTSGMGRDVAIAIRGRAIARTVLVKFNVGFVQGGAM